MGILALQADERVKDVHFTDETLSVDLADGRTIIVPLAWYPRLLNSTSEQRNHWEICGAGYGIHWPQLPFCRYLSLQSHGGYPVLKDRSPELTMKSPCRHHKMIRTDEETQFLWPQNELYLKFELFSARKKLDSTFQYRIPMLLFECIDERGFFVQEVNGACVNRCRQGDQPGGG